MKKKSLLLVLSLIGLSGYAQGHYGGQKAISINYMGLAKGKGVNLNYQKLVGQNYLGFRVDADYLQKDHNITVYEYSYKTDFLRYSIGSAFTYSLESIMSGAPVYVQLYAGAMYGQEKLNKQKGEIENIPYINPKTNIFGGYVGAEVEIDFARRWSFLINAKNSFTNSQVQKSLFQYGVGLKFILNDY